MYLGVHCSVSGGVHNACQEAASLGIDVFQIFTKNQRQWKEKRFTEEEQARFKETFREADIKLAFSHASYLINLAHAEPDGRNRAKKALEGEVERCHQLGLPFTVLHPGFPKEMGAEKGIALIAEGLREVLEATAHTKVKVLIENMAGQGSTVGDRFEHIRDIMDAANHPRVGTCFDTCHAFAAGYDIRTEAGTKQTFEAWDKVVGLQHLDALHLNDSKNPFDSRKDRHEHIGQGEIGEAPFRYIMQHFPETPKVIETPKVEDMDAVNLKLLRGLWRK